MGSIFFFAIERKKEARSKSRETRGKNQEARGKNQETCLPTGRQETRAEKQEIKLFAVRFLCACLPQAGLCAFASKKKKEPRDLSADRQARTKRIKSRFSHLASTIQISISQK
jgi:hypothetical protein